MNDIYKKFQVTSTYDTDVECEIWRFCLNLFLRYAANRRTDMLTHRHIHRHRPTSRNVIFGFGESHIVCNPWKSPFQKFVSKTILELFMSKKSRKKERFDLKLNLRLKVFKTILKLKLPLNKWAISVKHHGVHTKVFFTRIF